MLILGHRLIKTRDFVSVSKKSELKDEVMNCFHYDEGLIEKALKMDIEFSIFAKNTDEILLGNALGASFMLIEDENLAKSSSKMAEFYLFDSKILLLVSRLENLEKAYQLGVDGVILKGFIKKNSDYSNF